VHVDARVSATSVGLEFRNTGGVAAVFQVRSATPAGDPRTYTVEPDKRITDTWDFRSTYDLAVHGPNGFFRRFAGSHLTALGVLAVVDARRNDLVLHLTTHARERIQVAVTDRYTSRNTTLSLWRGESKTQRWSLDRTHGWYDLTARVSGDGRFVVSAG
jgi:phospholipase C